VRSDPTPDPGAVPEALCRAAGPPFLILVVDDDALNHTLIEDCLAPLGYRLLHARDGEEALAQVARARPDLVLLDIIMPGMDGFEVCRRLKAGQSERFLPVILFTERDDTRSKVQGLRAGADDYVTKPFVTQELVARIESMRRIQRLDKRLAAEKRRAERAKEKLERVIASMRDAVITVSPEGVVGLNPSAAMTLAPFLENGECHYADLCRILTLDPLAPGDEEEGHAPRVHEITLGEDVYGAILSVFPAAEEPEKGAGAVVVLRNITKEKELDRMKNEFVSFVSHELRTPLTSVKNSLSLLVSGRTGALPADAEKFLQIAARNASRLGALIDDLLDLSRIDAGKLELQLVLETLDRPIDASLGLFTTQAESKRLTITRDIPDGLPRVYLDANRIEQIVTNLVGNAIKFTREGGTIGVSARTLESLPPHAPRPVIPAAQYVAVGIEDNGIGIPMDMLEKIFDRFQQVRQGAGKGGTGLGLSIVRSMVEAHGGVIWAESKVGRWSRFTFALPVFGQEALYRYRLQTILDRARCTHELVSVINVRIEGGLRARALGGAWTMDDVFHAALAATEKVLLKSRDALLPLQAEGELRILLPDTAKQDALTVLRRLGVGLSKIFERGDGPRPELAYGIATYPEDGISAPELENHLAGATGPLHVGDGVDLPGDLDPFSLL